MPLRKVYVLPGLLFGALLALVGCESPGGGPGPFSSSGPPRDFAEMPVVIARVNQNSAAMNFLMRGGGVTATGEYLKSGKKESFELKGTLLYQKPQELYIDLQHTLGNMELGSNNQEYWVWEKLGNNNYWWGQHSTLNQIDDEEMPIRPDHLLQVLGLQDLPEKIAGVDGPIFWAGPTRYELMFLERDPTGRTYLSRTVDIDRKPPYLIREMVFFRPDGRPKMLAKLSEYRTIAGSKVLAPHLLKMRWLDTDSWMDLEFREMKRYDQAGAQGKFVSPRQKGRRNLGTVKRVDLSSTSTPPSAGDSAPPRVSVNN